MTVSARLNLANQLPRDEIARLKSLSAPAVQTRWHHTPRVLLRYSSKGSFRECGHAALVDADRPLRADLTFPI
ncbi:hypothetical protein HOY34_08015 [Xinfangfangia sp. D13-10-4-6]|uniref:hypothetical protein n=1 Tax=Pseudogemmobacter hezensis TaxID=2737662 RepID=UPI001551E443|nr:hypothetical protein [Pseudogemmobacter hezensis]NPD15145.1 hypothetical protein [Pseudogemmobacter hezensis]